MEISISGWFEIQRNSPICFSGFQQESVNVNPINCNILRLCALPLCRRSWWRQNNTNHSGLLLLYQTHAHPSLWAFPSKEGKKSVDVALYTEFLSAVVIKSNQALILLDHRTPLDLMSLLLQELHDILCAYTEPCKATQTAEKKLPLDFALENPVIQWEREAIKISSFHNFASQRRQVPHKEGLYDLERER